MNIKEIIQKTITQIIQNNYQLDNIRLEVQQNKTEFAGDFTIVTFPLVKQLKKSPDAIAEDLGVKLQEQSDFVQAYNVVKGFLNYLLYKNLMHFGS